MSEYMIMLNSACNLNCPYCFAQNNMDNSNGEILLEDFDKAVDFGLSNNGHGGIGIIGGEPTLHSEFDFLINRLITDKRVDSIDVFTNGTTICEHLSVLTNSKVHVLINCNPVAITGEYFQNAMLNGIDALFKAGVPLSRVGLGFNLCSENDDLDYYLSLVDRYHMDTVRVSVAVPNCSKYDGDKRFNFFQQNIKQVKLFVRRLFDRGVVPIFDCNKIPYCLIADEENLLLEKYKDNPNSLRAVSESNYLNGYSRCTPSIVVDKDLNAIRCFALSEISRESILDYKDLKSLQYYYEDVFDTTGYCSDHEMCTSCSKLINKECMGGCLVFKF